MYPLIVLSEDFTGALTELPRCTSKAPIICVVGEHDHENEKQARNRGVLFYSAKPLIRGDVNLLLQHLLRMQGGRRDLANRQVREVRSSTRASSARGRAVGNA